MHFWHWSAHLHIFQPLLLIFLLKKCIFQGVRYLIYRHPTYVHYLIHRYPTYTHKSWKKQKNSHFSMEFRGYFGFQNQFTSSIPSNNQITIISPYKKDPRGIILTYEIRGKWTLPKFLPFIPSLCIMFWVFILNITNHSSSFYNLSTSLYWHVGCEDLIFGLVHLESN